MMYAANRLSLPELRRAPSFMIGRRRNMARYADFDSFFFFASVPMMASAPLPYCAAFFGRKETPAGMPISEANCRRMYFSTGYPPPDLIFNEGRSEEHTSELQ